MNQVDFFGLKLTSFDNGELSDEIEKRIKNGEKTVCYGYSFATIALFKKYPELYGIINNFDILVSDGRWFYLFARYLGAGLKSDFSIPDLVNLVLKLADKNGFSVMLVGGTPENNFLASKKIKEKYNNIPVTEGFDGYFEQEKGKKIEEKINIIKPDIVLLGMSSPGKENLAGLWRKLPGTSMIIPCGGMIDVIAGKVRQTPGWLKKIGLATPYRVIQEPKRLFLLNIFYTWETFFRIIPTAFFHFYFRKNRNFSLPGLYGIRKNSVIE